PAQTDNIFLIPERSEESQVHREATGSQPPPQTRFPPERIPEFRQDLLPGWSEAPARSAQGGLLYASEGSILFHMYSSHLRLQSSTVRITPPAGLPPLPLSGFFLRSDSHWYIRKYSCWASPLEACRQESEIFPGSHYPTAFYKCQTALYGRRWYSRSHGPAPW